MLLEWRRPGEHPFQPPARQGAELGVEEPVEQRVPQPQAERGPRGPGPPPVHLLLVPAPRNRGGDRRVEDLAQVLLLGLRLRAPLDLLQHARHHHEEGGPDLRERGHHLGGVGEVGHPHAGLHREHLQGAREDVGERQEDDGVRPLVHHLRVGVQHCEGLTHEVPVSDQHTLGGPGGTGRVDDGGDVVGTGHRTTLRDDGVGHLGTPGDERGEVRARSGVHGPDRQGAHAALGAGGAQEVGVRLLARHREDRLAVRDDRGRLGHGRRGVERHHHGAGVRAREVRDRPLVPGGGHDGDGVARLHPGGNHPLGNGDDRVLELARRHVAPGAAVGQLEGHVVRRGSRAAGEQVGDVPEIGALGRGRGGELDHGSAFRAAGTSSFTLDPARAAGQSPLR